MIFIPDIAIQNLLENGLDTIKADFNKGEQSRFYKSLKFYSVGKLNYFEEAKAIFSRNNNDPKKIEIRRYFDINRASLPTLHITIPLASFGNIHGIGNDEGLVQDQYEENNIISPQVIKSFNANFQIICTGQNPEEANLIATVFQIYLLGIFDVLESIGFIMTKIGLADLQSAGDMAPMGVMYRAITMNFLYYLSVPSFVEDPKFNGNLLFQGIAKKSEN